MENEKPRTEEAIMNQTYMSQNGVRLSRVSYLMRFQNMAPDHGPGAIMLTILENPGLKRKQLIELLHQKFHTTGQYVEALATLICAKVIHKPNGIRGGFEITALGRDVLRENGLID